VCWIDLWPSLVLNAPRIVPRIRQRIAAGVAEQDLPEQWINAANLTLRAALRRHAPHAINWSGMKDIIPLLDEFESHMATKASRRH
jgi:hypothetical protein